MYSIISVDISVSHSDFEASGFIYDQQNIAVLLGYKSIIMGSSTINEDSAHSKGSLNNYVSFYIHSIKIKYDICYNNPSVPTPLYINPFPTWIILFKIPYKDETELRKILFATSTSTNFKDMILYSHPECILTYDVLNLNSKNVLTSHVLNYYEPFIIRPNDYVGILYYIPVGFSFDDQHINLYDVNSTAKVKFKPL